MTAKDFAEAKAIFEAAGIAQNAFTDCVLEPAEIRNGLNVYINSYRSFPSRDVTVEGLNKLHFHIGPQRFAEVKTILARHGFHIYDEALPEEIGLNSLSSSARLWDDREFILTIAQRAPGIVRSLASMGIDTHDFKKARAFQQTLLRDPEFMRIAIRSDPSMIEMCDESLLQNRQFFKGLITDKELNIATGVFQYILAQQDIGPIFQTKMNRLRQRLMQDPEYHEILFHTLTTTGGLAVMGKIRPADRDRIWKQVVGKISASGTVLPKQFMGSYAQMLHFARAQGVEFPERIHSVTHLANVLLHRTRDFSDTRPTALFIYPKDDWNDAFSIYPVIDTYIAAGFQALYFEARDEHEAKSILRRETRNLTVPAHTTWAAGHGNGATLALGAKDRRLHNTSAMDETKYIDTEDFVDPNDDLGQVLAGACNQHFVYFSCLSGHGLETGKNLSNATAPHLPASATIYGLGTSSNIKTFTIDSAGAPHIVLDNGPVYVRKGNN